MVLTLSNLSYSARSKAKRVNSISIFHWTLLLNGLLLLNDFVSIYFNWTINIFNIYILFVLLVFATLHCLPILCSCHAPPLTAQFLTTPSPATQFLSHLATIPYLLPFLSYISPRTIYSTSPFPRVLHRPLNSYPTFLVLLTPPSSSFLPHFSTSYSTSDLTSPPLLSPPSRSSYPTSSPGGIAWPKVSCCRFCGNFSSFFEFVRWLSLLSPYKTNKRNSERL